MQRLVPPPLPDFQGVAPRRAVLTLVIVAFLSMLGQGQGPTGGMVQPDATERGKQAAGGAMPRSAELERFSGLVGEWEGAHQTTKGTDIDRSPLRASFAWVLADHHLRGTLGYPVNGIEHEAQVTISHDPE